MDLTGVVIRFCRVSERTLRRNFPLKAKKGEAGSYHQLKAKGWCEED